MRDDIAGVRKYARSPMLNEFNSPSTMSRGYGMCSTIALATTTSNPPLFSMAAVSGATLTATYRYRLTTLDSQLPESVCEARAALRALMPQAGPEDRTAMFRAFRDFYLAAPRETLLPFTLTVEPFSRDIMIWLNKSGDGSASGMAGLLEQRADIRKTVGRWLGCGFSVEESEGDLYPGLNSATITEFAHYLPADLEEYLWFRAREDVETIVYDAGLWLSWEELRKTLTRWEAAARRYPNLEETPLEVEPKIRWLAWLYFLGISNTPSFDFKSGRIEEADGKLFERFGFEEEFREWWQRYPNWMDHPPR
jgi:hypothetical protein